MAAALRCKLIWARAGRKLSQTPTFFWLPSAAVTRLFGCRMFSFPYVFTSIWSLHKLHRCSPLRASALLYLNSMWTVLWCSCVFKTCRWLCPVVHVESRTRRSQPASWIMQLGWRAFSLCKWLATQSWGLLEEGWLDRRFCAYGWSNAEFSRPCIELVM